MGTGGIGHAAIGIAIAAASLVAGDATRVCAAQASTSPQAALPDSRQVIKRYCVTCHNGRLKTAGLALDNLDPL